MGVIHFSKNFQDLDLYTSDVSHDSSVNTQSRSQILFQIPATKYRKISNCEDSTARLFGRAGLVSPELAVSHRPVRNAI